MATSRRRKSALGSEGVLAEVMEENSPNLEEIFITSEEITEPAEEIALLVEEEPLPIVEVITTPPTKVKKKLDLRKPVRTPRNVPRFSSVRKTT